MKFELRPRDRRALVLLTAALVIYAAADWFILPAYDRLASAEEAAADKEVQLRRYRRAELRKGQYDILLKLASDRVLKSEVILIPGANLSLASAEVQALIEAAGNKVGLMVGQRSMSAPRRINDFYAELPMTLSFESTPGQLVAFLSELRALPRYMSIRSLQVAPVAPVFEVPKGADLSKNVRVSMTISAFAAAELVKPGAEKK